MASSGSSAASEPAADPPGSATAQSAVGLARAFAGALIFALPMLMTMEMWEIGFYISPWRLIILFVVLVPLLAGLSKVSGFEPTETLKDDIVDAFVAIAVATVTAAVVLWVFGVVTPEMPVREIVGKIALQAFPGSIGAMLARDQMHGAGDEERPQSEVADSYPGELFLMVVGALFLGLNVAPTEEMILLSFKMEPWNKIALVLLSLTAMHAFVYAVEFPGGSGWSNGGTFWSLFLRFTVVGYALVLIVCLYLLWTFGRTDGASVETILSAAVVLGFPCAIGAAAARLIL